MVQAFEPAYLKLLRSGELKARVEAAYKRLEACDICPRECGVNRRESAKGAVCRTGEKAVVSSFNPHFGEEAPLVGRGGSGTIFFGNCNLRCVYCQNYQLSQNWQKQQSHETNPHSLAQKMLYLQNELGCHNINFVTPEHVVPQVLEALVLAIERGLELPIVYNTSAYDSLESLELFDGIVDVYMPDLKFYDEDASRKYLKAEASTKPPS